MHTHFVGFVMSQLSYLDRHSTCIFNATVYGKTTVQILVFPLSECFDIDVSWSTPIYKGGIHISIILQNTGLVNIHFHIYVTLLLLLTDKHGKRYYNCGYAEADK